MKKRKLIIALWLSIYLLSNVGTVFAHSISDDPTREAGEQHDHFFDKVYYESQVDKNLGIVVSKYNPGPLADTVEESEERDVWTFYNSTIGVSVGVINDGLGYNAMDRVKKTWTAQCTVQPGTTCFVGLVEIWYKDYFFHHIHYKVRDVIVNGSGTATKFNRYHYYSCEVQGEAVAAPNPCSGWNPSGGEYIERPSYHGHNHQDNT